MQHKIIRTPYIVNTTFLALLILPLVILFTINKVSASPVNCTEVYFADKMWPVDLKDYPQCQKKFQYLTRMRIKQFLNHK